MRAAGFLLACLPGGSSKDDVGTADSFFNDKIIKTHFLVTPANVYINFPLPFISSATFFTS